MWVGFEMRMGRGGQEGGYLYSMAGQKDQKRSMVFAGIKPTIRLIRTVGDENGNFF